MNKIKSSSVLEIIKESLSEDQILEFAEDYGLSYSKAKQGLAEYIHESERGR